MVKPKFAVPYDTALYEESAREIWDRYKGKMPKTVLDIGAHIGAFGLLLACNGAKFVQVVEADYENYWDLLDHIKLNKCLARVLPTYGAVTDTSLEQAILYRMTGSSGVRSLLDNYQEALNDTQPVWTLALEDLISPIVSKYDTLDFLKIDIEGGEWKALTSRPKLIAALSSVGYIDVECHNDNPETLFQIPEARVNSLIWWLENMGFKIMVSDKNGLHICGRREYDIA